MWGFYFECNCKAKETAEQVFVHYDTINYRLERIKERARSSA
ncbi:helix-turn-helix domain-containing protein [Cohnella boryungensis]|uniref:Helix-turn-helix domain-containing protein n=1 Tax=Cohnella boryungensis TaxID=768479 RepID=A0ABV8S3C2_9BACL